MSEGIKYRNLGNTGTRVSPLCLGAMTFGEPVEGQFMHKVGSDEATSFEILDRAVAAGVNFIDTADVYGQDGLSERVLGDWLTRSKKRDQIVLATKFRFRMSEGPNGGGASRYRIMRTAEASLKRLQTDRLDLYQIHSQDVDTPEDETLRALDDLIHQGKVLYIGASNYAAYRLVESLFTSDKLNLHRFVSLQAQYSLAVRDLERELVPACQKFGLAILPWSPLAAGFLSGKYQRGQPPPPGTRFTEWKQRFASFDNDRGWRIVDAVTKVAREAEATPSQVALAWLLQKPGVTSVIFGARTVAQLEDNLKALRVKLSADHLDQLEKASAYELGYPYDFLRRVQERW